MKTQPAKKPTRRPKSKESVNHPKHYNTHPAGIECIDIIEHMPANIAFVIKHLWREGQKGAAMVDLLKAQWYLNREIARRSKFKI